MNKDDLKTTDIVFTTNSNELKADYIVTVPTPIDNEKNPDLTPLIQASDTVGGYWRKRYRSI